MRFLYKIHSGYDGFRPSVLPVRIQEGRLQLGWRHYIEVVEKGWECWVYFHGPHRFENGVYVKGIVDNTNLASSEVTLRVREYSVDSPLTTRETSARVADVVRPRYRQVFVWPDDLSVVRECKREACKDRHCIDCETWANLPLIRSGDSKPPSRLRWSKYEDIVAAHWIVPSRCYEHRIVDEIQDLTNRFTEFKWGEMAYAYPFALSIFEQLRSRDLLEFDYVVPIPLSPDKADVGEMHRTLVLAKELSRLLAVDVLEMLNLSSSVSKRQMLSKGATIPQFEKRYRKALRVNVPKDTNRLLLVDDVMTRGSTAAQALDAISDLRSDVTVVIATAGQMIVKEAVIHDGGFKRSKHNSGTTVSLATS